MAWDVVIHQNHAIHEPCVGECENHRIEATSVTDPLDAAIRGFQIQWLMYMDVDFPNITDKSIWEQVADNVFLCDTQDSVIDLFPIEVRKV